MAGIAHRVRAKIAKTAEVARAARAPTGAAGGPGADMPSARPSATRRTILLASHSHPQLSKGGSEIAAFQLFTALKSRTGYEPWFLGCVRDPAQQKLGTTLSQPFSEREFLYSAGAFDWFKFANQDRKFPGEFRELLRRLQPQVVHFHHYLNFGVEAFLHVREMLPDCRIILTLHEYLAVCHHYGQMVTKPSRSLCHESSPTRCAGCFEDLEGADFFLRKQYIRRFFETVDHFIAPSHFLAKRYVAWGIEPHRISVIENVIMPLTGEALKPRHGRELLRIGFFGQISLLKGINVLFETADLLLERKVYHIVFEIHGDHRGQPPEFQEDFLERVAKPRRNLSYHGAYDQERVDGLMQSMDLILVPSVWWENSPVVIQEALRNRRPVICSDIGGMAEKVRDGLDGFHFPVGSSPALASLLLRLADSQTALNDVAATLRPPELADEVVDRHLQLYACRVTA